MTDSEVPPVLLAAAVLAARPQYDSRVRSLMLSRISPSDIRGMEDVRRALVHASHEAGVRSAGIPAPTSRGLASAALLAREWVNRGVRVIPCTPSVVPGSSERHLPPILFARGDPTLLAEPAAAILNSRKPRHVRPSDPWIVTTVRLVAEARAAGRAIISSYDTLPYRLVSRLARGGAVTVVCPDVLPFMDTPERLNRFLALYGDLFDEKRTLFVSPFPLGKPSSKHDRPAERDRLVAALAGVLYVADVRPGGIMAEILADAERRRVDVRYSDGKELDRTRVAAAAGAASFGVYGTKSADPASRPTERRRAFDTPRACPAGTAYLVHYTRSCPGPWPGQTVARYCDSLINDEPGASHTGFDTLQRILSERTIRGSAKLVPGPRPVVSFTERLPHELEELVRWRRGLVRWSFEPYGIAVPAERLIEMGARKVAYRDRDAPGTPPTSAPEPSAVHMTAAGEWAEEREWRLEGDLALDEIPFRDIVALVPSPDEAGILKERFGCAVAWSGLPAKGSG